MAAAPGIHGPSLRNWIGVNVTVEQEALATTAAAPSTDGVHGLTIDNA